MRTTVSTVCFLWKNFSHIFPVVTKKREGLLPRFDPSSRRIRPKDRIGLVINFQRRKPARDEDYVSDSDTSEETDTGSDFEGAYVRRGTRASKRQAGKLVRALPFSPRTARRRKRGDYSDSEEEWVSEMEDERPTRRSSRATKKRSYATGGDTDLEEEQESSEHDDDGSRREHKKVVKRRGPKPAYGRIRRIEENYDSDPETTPLRAHRNECEKCHRAPAHILLRRLKKGKGRRKRVDDDLSEDEESFYYRLGGWVRWYENLACPSLSFPNCFISLKCCVAAHWNCLSRFQRAEILKAARSREGTDGSPLKTTALDITEATEFV